MSRAISLPRRTTLAIAIATVLSGCGGGSGSNSTPVIPSTTLSGVVVDGYLSGSTVFWDANNNGILDAGEPSTQTDSSGHFSLSVTGSGGQLNGGHLRVTGGTDTAIKARARHG